MGYEAELVANLTSFSRFVVVFLASSQRNVGAKTETVKRHSQMKAGAAPEIESGSALEGSMSQSHIMFIAIDSIFYIALIQNRNSTDTFLSAHDHIIQSPKPNSRQVALVAQIRSKRNREPSSLRIQDIT